jgi:hypothetical protein
MTKQKTIFDKPKVKYWINTIFYILIVGFIVYVGFKIYVWYNVQKKIIKSNLDTETVTDENGNEISVDLGLKASQLYNAFHYGLFGWFEDEAEAITILQSVPAELIPKLEAIYLSLTGEDLEKMFLDYTDFTKVSYLFN